MVDYSDFGKKSPSAKGGEKNWKGQGKFCGI